MTGHPESAGRIFHPPFPPPRFWDNLSRPVLAKSALYELQRRIAAAEDSRAQADSQHRRYYTRNQALLRASPDLAADKVLNRLTATDRVRIRRFARQGGPGLGELRGYHQPQGLEMASLRQVRRRRGRQAAGGANELEQTTQTLSTGPYDPAFEQHIIDHNVLPPEYESPDGEEAPEPENKDEIVEVLKRRRRSLSPSRFTQTDFKRFKRANANAKGVSQVMANVVPVLEGGAVDSSCAARDVRFSNLQHLTDGTLTCAKPDLYYGSRPEKLEPAIRQELTNLVVPSKQHALPVAPNHFLEASGMSGSLAVATRQVTYDTALGSRGLHALQTYGVDDPPYDNRARTLGWTYHGWTLNAYASHLIPPSAPGGQPGYATTPVGSWAMTSDLDTFRRGASAFRNGREWAELQREEAIAQANQTAAGRDDESGGEAAEEEETPEATGGQVTSSEGGSPSTRSSAETSADELSLNYEPPPKPRRGKGEMAADAAASKPGPGNEE